MTNLSMIIICSFARLEILTAIEQRFRFAIKLAYLGLRLDQHQGWPVAARGLHDQIPVWDVSRVRQPPTPHGVFAARVKKGTGLIEQPALLRLLPTTRHPNGIGCDGKPLRCDPLLHGI